MTDFENLAKYRRWHTELDAISNNVVALDDGVWRCVMCLSAVDGEKVMPWSSSCGIGSLDAGTELATGYECMCCGTDMTPKGGAP